MDLPRTVGSDYFCDVIPVQKDKTKSQMVLQAVMQKHEAVKNIESMSSLVAHRAEVAEEMEENIKLAEELAKEKRRQFLKEKLRLRIRENNHELKELEVKLRAAYVAKSLKAQIAEKEALKKQEKLREIEEDAVLKSAILKEEEILKVQQKEEAERKQQLKKILQDQIISVQQERSKRYEEFLREKKFIDEIMKKIHEEQLEEMRREFEKKARYREDIDNFIRIQEAWKEQQKRDIREEDERLRKFFEEREILYKEMEDKRRKDLGNREEISYKIGQKIFQTTEEKLKREELLRELHAAEKEANEEQKIRKQIEEQICRKIQLRKDLEKHREEVILRKKQEQEDDKAFYEEQMQIYAERDKIDQMSNENRRRKILLHRKELQKCLEERKIRRAEEVAELLKHREQEVEEENLRQQLIEEERINILKEHAINILGYLPPGILKESDREFLALPTSEK